MKLGIEVRDFPCEGLTGDDEIAAVVVCGATIALNPGIEDDDLQADVLAMALEIAAVMTNRQTSDPGEVYAPGGFVLITTNRIPAPQTRPPPLRGGPRGRPDPRLGRFRVLRPPLRVLRPRVRVGRFRPRFLPARA